MYKRKVNCRNTYKTNTEKKTMSSVATTSAGAPSGAVVPLPDGFEGSVPQCNWHVNFVTWVDSAFPAVKPFGVTLSSGKTIHFFLHRSLTPASKELIRSKCGRGTPYYCNVCRDRMLIYLTLFGESGCVFDASAFGLPAAALKYTPGYTGVSFPTKQLYHPLFEGSNNNGRFPHVTLAVTDWNNPADVPSWWHSLVHKYYPMVLRLFLENGVEGIQESLEILHSLLSSKDGAGRHRIPYGDKLEQSVSWLKEHLRDDFTRQSPIALAVQVVTAILRGNGVPNADMSSDPIMTWYHQVKDNGLDVLTCAQDEKAVIAILKERFSPTNYCRPTAAPSDGQIEIAMKKLGAFEVTVMTAAQAADFGAIAFSGKDPTSSSNSSMAAFAAMKSKKSGAAGFASRTTRKVFSPPTRFSELLAMASDVRLEMYAEGSPSTAYTTTLGDKALYPHLWCYENGKSPSHYGLNSWTPISSVLPMKWEEGKGRHCNFLFISPQARLPSKVANCCFPEFLAPAYQRICRTAFEKLNKLMTPTVPPTGPYAAGVGTSITGADGTFYKPLRFRVNGVECTIARW